MFDSSSDRLKTQFLSGKRFLIQSLDYQVGPLGFRTMIGREGILLIRNSGVFGTPAEEDVICYYRNLTDRYYIRDYVIICIYKVFIPAVLKYHLI